MRCRAAGSVAVAVICSWVLAEPGFAAEAEIERQAWAETAELSDPAFVPQAERIYASARLGKEESRSFVVLHFGTIDRADIEELSLTLAEADASMQAEQASLVACTLAEPLPSDEDLAEGEVPRADCRTRVDGVRDGSTDGLGRWTFELDSFLDAWLAGANYGLAIFPDLAATNLPVAPGSPETYRVAFDATRTSLDAAVVPSMSSPSRTAPPEQAPSESSGPVASPLPIDDGASSPVPVAEPSTTPVTGDPVGEQPRPMASSRPDRSADSPSSLLIVGIAVALLASAIALDRFDIVSFAAVSEAAARFELGGHRARWLAAGAAVVVVPPLVFDDSALFKWGFVLIFITASAGMHLLVNWTGQLSLAHAAMIGLPAFAVGKLSVDLGISPIVLLPIALLVGAVLGGIVALPALRVRGFYIAVITLAAGVAIERFFFTREWLIGPGALSVPRATLGPIEFDTFSSLYPWMALLFVGVMSVLLGLYRSKVARAFWWIKSDPDAAAAAGINTSAYIILAYVIAGTLAGLAGGLTAIWVRQLTPTNFPLSLAFSYLIIAVLAGPGPMTGLLVTVFVLQGLPLFHEGIGTVVGYAAPIAVLIMLTRFPGGVNALGPRLLRTATAGRIRALSRRVYERGEVMDTGIPTRPTRTLIVGVSLIVVGLVAIGLAWYHTGNTDQVWVQVQEVASGGLGGLALVIIGTGLVVRDQMARNAELITRTLRTPAVGMSGQRFVFPIADYDELKVFEIVPLLDELFPDELELVREREAATKARAGVLRRIDALLARQSHEARNDLVAEGDAQRGQVDDFALRRHDLKVARAR